MAAFVSLCAFFFFILTQGLAAAPDNSYRCFPLLFAFGDSLTDTGNAQRIFPFEQNRASHFPYGQTYFGRPRDRFSDGRLMIDFIAQALQLPLLYPYVQSVGSSFAHGVNFATSGATATNITFLVPHTLKIQYYWLKKFKIQVRDADNNPVNTALLPNIDDFSKALYVVFIGGNDYNARLFVYNMTIQQMTNDVPIVVDVIASTIENLYAESARAFLIINIPPVGCTPELLTYLTYFSTPSDYDDARCFGPYNSLLQLHNDVLRDAVDRLRIIYTDALFVYADYYRITYDILRDPTAYGITEGLHACCGIGGRYNFNFTVQCGATVTGGDGVPHTPASCPNPTTAANWDGVHPTEAFTRIIITSFLPGNYIEPSDAFKHCQFDFSSF